MFAFACAKINLAAKEKEGKGKRKRNKTNRPHPKFLNINTVFPDLKAYVTSQGEKLKGWKYVGGESSLLFLFK